MENNITLKVSLFIVITFIFTSALALLQQKINIGFEKIVLPQLAPMLSYMVTTLIFKNIKFNITLEISKVVILKSLFAFVFPFGLIFISYFIAKLNGIEVQITKEFVPLFTVSIIGILIGSFGEEVGWRSFLLPLLESKKTALVSSIIVGLIWGLWHIGHYKNGLLFMVTFLIFIVSASIILTWLLKSTNYNIIISIAFHTSINLGFLMFFKNSLNDPKLMLINCFVWFSSVLVIFMIMRKNLLSGSIF